MDKGKIGLNSGILWNLLTSEEQICADELQKQSGLTSLEFWAAIGWLARENKIDIIEERIRYTICHGSCFYF